MKYKCKNCGKVIESNYVNEEYLTLIKEHDKLHRERYDGEYK